MEEKNTEFTLRDLIDIIIPKAWIVALISVIVAMVTGVYSAFFVKNTYSTTLEFNVTASSTSVSKELVPVFFSAYKSEIFCSAISGELENNSNYKNVKASQIQGMLSFNQSSSVPVFTITITSTDKNLAHSVKNAIYALSYDDPTGDIPATLKSLIPNSSVKLQPYSDSESAPRLNNDKNVLKKTVLAFGVAMVVSLAGVVVYALIDPTVRDRKKAESCINAPLIGAIPRCELKEQEVVHNEEESV